MNETTTAQAKGTAAARAALIASDYCHDALPFRLAELAAGWALEAFVNGWDHVPGSDAADAGRSLTVADEALAEIRFEARARRQEERRARREAGTLSTPSYVDNASTVHRGTSGSLYRFVPDAGTATGPVRIGTRGSLYLVAPDPERPGALEEVLVDTDVARDPNAIEVAVDRADEEVRTVVAEETVEVETCEHGLSAWLCEGPQHYPADRPY